MPILGDRLAEASKGTPTGRTGEQFVTPLSAPRLPGRYYFLYGEPIDTAAVDPKDKAGCAALYSEVKQELEGCIEYLLARRKDDPNEKALPRVALEAASNWQRQAPTFPL